MLNGSMDKERKIHKLGDWVGVIHEGIGIRGLVLGFDVFWSNFFLFCFFWFGRFEGDVREGWVGDEGNG